MILSKSEIEYFKQNQKLITQELLDALRSQGKDGKRVALEILDMQKNDRMYYVDAFDDPISFNGNKGLKKVGAILNLSHIHVSEIERCAKDFNYFRENYIQIKAPKGIDFPDIREYQNRFIDAMLMDEKEEVVGLMGRQCVGAETRLNMIDRDRTIKELFDTPEE